MKKSSTILLGAGLLAAAFAAPAAARDNADDEALAFVIGAAVGHVISDGDVPLRYAHGRHHRKGPGFRQFRWHHRHKAFHRKWQRRHSRYHRFDRYEHRRQDRHHRRDHRRHDWHHRRDHRRHDRHHHGDHRRHDRDHRRDHRRDRRDHRRGRGWH